MRSQRSWSHALLVLLTLAGACSPTTHTPSNADVADAGPADSGVADAAALLDASRPDANGVPDAATPDAAVGDAGAQDAALPDAAFPDAAPADAGTAQPDASVPPDSGTAPADAGPADAASHADASAAQDASVPLDGGTPDAAPVDAGPRPTRWADFIRQPNPTYVGQYAFDSDGSVIRDGNVYRMTYTCFDPDKSPTRPGMVLCEATSPDGQAWTRVQTGLDAQVEGKILDPVPGSWADTLETSFLLKAGNRYLMYFVGYRDDPAGGGFFASWPSKVGLATSTDGIHFTARAEPILGNRPRHYDADAISSPSVIPFNGGYVMIYAAYCFTACDHATGMVVAGAISVDGEAWTALDQAVLLPRADIPWMSKHVGEAELVEGPDGFFYLFVTGISATDVQSIGVMRAPHPLGPWDIRPTPILSLMPGAFDADHVVAPSVLVENGRVRLWYSGFSATTRQSVTGYAEAPWPLVLP